MGIDADESADPKQWHPQQSAMDFWVLWALPGKKVRTIYVGIKPKFRMNGKFYDYLGAFKPKMFINKMQTHQPEYQVPTRQTRSLGIGQRILWNLQNLCWVWRLKWIMHMRLLDRIRGELKRKLLPDCAHKMNFTKTEMLSSCSANTRTMPTKRGNNKNQMCWIYASLMIWFN